MERFRRPVAQGIGSRTRRWITASLYERAREASAQLAGAFVGKAVNVDQAGGILAKPGAKKLAEMKFGHSRAAPAVIEPFRGDSARLRLR